MRAFGLTGNIGCGKSTIASLLREMPGTLIVDCDKVAKTVLHDPVHRTAIVALLGADVVNGNSIETSAVAQTIFTNAEKRRAFEAFMHPLVWAKVEALVAATDSSTLCVVESAILYEQGNTTRFNGMIVVTCDEAEQLRRLREHRSMESEDIRLRIAAQWPSSKKAALADFVINTNCSMDELRVRTKRLYVNLKGVC